MATATAPAPKSKKKAKKVAKVKKAKKPDFTAADKNLRPVLMRLAKVDNLAGVIKSAITTGVLSADGVMTVLTEDEKHQIKKVKVEGLKDATEVASTVKIPSVVGYTATVKENEDGTVTVSTANEELQVTADSVIKAMIKRHPNAQLHFAHKDPEKGPLYFATRTAIVGVCPVVIETK